MKHHLFSIIFSVLLALVSFESWGQSGLYTVTGDKVVIRSGPGTNYSKVSSRKKGDTVTVLSLYDGNWARVQMGGSEGYISRQYITFKGPLPGQTVNKTSSSKQQGASFDLKMGDVGKFWLFLALAIGLYILSMVLSETLPFISLLINVLSAGAIYLWTEVSSECFWYLDFEHQNILLWFFYYLLTALFFGLIAGTAWGNLKAISELFSDFIPSILCVIVGVVWGIVLLRLVGIMFDEHPIITFLTLVGAIPSSRVPTIYVPGEGYITGHGYDGGSRFHGDNGNHYWYDGDQWNPD